MEPDPDNAGVGIERAQPDADSSVNRRYTGSAKIRSAQSDSETAGSFG